ncbi:MAG TPA: TIGR03790 family protein, partial [Gemmata sp.]|nr:TIGR03790 family protein [Gemmata sp.]
MRFVLVALVATFALPALALEPANVWLVVNRNGPESRQVADHYIARRGVPKSNVIVLDLPKGETISRPDYNVKLAGPIRAALMGHRDTAKVLLTTFGVPLRVEGETPSAADKKELEKLRPEIDAAKKKVAELEKKKDAKELTAGRNALAALQNRERYYARAESHACVDSELMLLWWPKYDLPRWIPNPMNFQASQAYRNGKEPVMMTARLDGPTAAIAMRLVDDAVAVEAKGLDGNVVIDA